MKKAVNQSSSWTAVGEVPALMNWASKHGLLHPIPLPPGMLSLNNEAYVLKVKNFTPRILPNNLLMNDDNQLEGIPLTCLQWLKHATWAQKYGWKARAIDATFTLIQGEWALILYGTMVVKYNAKRLFPAFKFAPFGMLLGSTENCDNINHLIEGVDLGVQQVLSLSAQEASPSIPLVSSSTYIVADEGKANKAVARKLGSPHLSCYPHHRRCVRKNKGSHLTSDQVDQILDYITTLHLAVTTPLFLELQDLMKCIPLIKQPPLVDCLVLMRPAQSVSLSASPAQASCQG